MGRQVAAGDGELFVGCIGSAPVLPLSRKRRSEVGERKGVGGREKCGVRKGLRDRFKSLVRNGFVASHWRRRFTGAGGNAQMGGSARRSGLGPGPGVGTPI